MARPIVNAWRRSTLRGAGCPVGVGAPHHYLAESWSAVVKGLSAPVLLEEGG